MTDDLGDQLASDEGRRVVAAHVAHLVRRQEFERAERFLHGGLTAHPGPVSSACRGVGATDVELHGWQELDADLVRLRRLGHDVTAIGLDLSNYNDAETAHWWDKEPVVELSAYTDAVFPFSTSSRAELLRQTASAGPPWTGAGTGEETAFLEVTGLRPLNGALLRHASENSGPAWRRKTPDRESVAAFLGGWWLHLRFHQAVRRHLDEVGLALRVPVVVGSHDLGPWLQSVYLVDKVTAVQPPPGGQTEESVADHPEAPRAAKGRPRFRRRPPS